MHTYFVFLSLEVQILEINENIDFICRTSKCVFFCLLLKIKSIYLV